VTPLRLKELRERKGWSQAELARRAGLNDSVVNRVERGKSNVTLVTLEKIATALRVNVRSLFAE